MRIFFLAETMTTSTITKKKKQNESLQYLPFENEIADLDGQLKELTDRQKKENIDLSSEIRKLQSEQTKKLQAVYSSLSPWQTVQLARHPQRPLFSDYLNLMIKDSRILHGDRAFRDDKAIITALGQIGREKVMVIGQDKGKEIKDKVACNFGCPNPEGYRKALAKMKLAEKFNLPIVTFIDTPGAYPGIGAEERGQAQAIAVNLMEMSRLKVPVISIVIGEGGSGGALGIGVADKLAILQFAYYSVISPEGCAAILWRDGTQTEPAAKALKLTSGELKELNLVDSVIPEPLGGAHRNIHDTVYNVEQFIIRTLRQLKNIPIDKLLQQRYEKLRNLGTQFQKGARPAAVKIPERLSVQAQLQKASQYQESKNEEEIENPDSKVNEYSSQKE
jgi:acetyl-CoA carboxylase carboxyl transferase subunit alpha